MERFQLEKIKEDLGKKMVFLTGPRQVGKTWLAKEVSESYKNSLYLNYDNLDDRKVIESREWSSKIDLLILDELHKMSGWKNFLKGIYDTRDPNMHLLVTGSARLDTFRNTGDSLAGRYFVHHLLPFTPSEVAHIKNENEIGLFHMLERGGFPEPLLAKSKEEAERWRSLYTEDLIRDDVLDFENIRDLRSMKKLLELLRHKVGSPVSYAGLARDLEISPTTVKNYISILEALYVVFRVTPYSSKIAGSIRKEPKIYFYDTGLVRGEPGVVFENLVALSLLKKQESSRDLRGATVELRYIRMKDSREVDFALVEEGEVLELIEAKLRDTSIHNPLVTMQKRFNVPAAQVVLEARYVTERGLISIVPAEDYLSKL